MWTYLILFLGALTLTAIFIRKMILALKGEHKKAPAKEPLQRPEDKIDEKTLSSKDKNQAEGLFEKGKSFIKTGKEDDAIRCFVQVLAVDDAHIDTQQELAMLYMNKKMYSAAAALFKQLAELTDDPVHFSHLGFALYQQSDLEPSKIAYQKAIDLDPSRPQRFVSLSQVYRSLEEFSPAMIALNKALELEKENLDFLFLLADLQLEAGLESEAKITLHNLVQLDPENAEAKALLKKIQNPGGNDTE